MQIFDFNFKVTVNEIDDDDYTPPQALVKQILEDIDDNEKEPIFNIALIDNEREKEFDGF